MSRDFTIRRRLAAIALGAVGIGTAAFAQTAATSRPASASGTEAQPTGEWHNYAADSRSSKYSPLDQIDKTNVHQLEIAWRWKSIDYGLAAQHEGIVPPFVFQNTPMMRDGRVLVATGIGAAALDPSTGEILWTYDPFDDEAPRNMGRLSVRGGVTWNDGSTRRLFFVANGRLTALDLDTGEHLWMVPNGDGPRDHPALAHLDLPPLGQQGRVSALVTKTLVFLADGSDAMVVQPAGAGSRKFRAYDKTNGEVVWEMDLPAGVSGAPMTYLHEGRQYIVMAISGTGFEGELLALALPGAPPAAAP